MQELSFILGLIIVCFTGTLWIAMWKGQPLKTLWIKLKGLELGATMGNEKKEKADVRDNTDLNQNI